MPCRYVSSIPPLSTVRATFPAHGAAPVVGLHGQPGSVCAPVSRSTVPSPWTACAFAGSLWSPLAKGEGPSPSVPILMCVAVPRADSEAPSAFSWGLGVALGAPCPTLPSPAHPPGTLPCSSCRTPTACWRWRDADHPVPALGLPPLPPGEHPVDLEPKNRPSAAVVLGPSFAHHTHGRLDRLTSHARSVRGPFARRARHASGDAPWHP